ncbi:MAG: hypothetical protein AAF581_06865 [Planctomycetota bacterium]
MFTGANFEDNNMQTQDRTAAASSSLIPFTIAALLALTVWPGLANAQDPEPFRRDDEVAGRDFQYNELSFLHRFSYRYRPASDWSWSRHRQGYRGTGGSVRSDELYVEQELRKRLELDSSLFFDFRHRVSEDFDGRYDRTLTGVGLRLRDSWSVTLLADIVGNKGDIDTHLETAWTGEQHHLRLALVLPDTVVNSKGDVDRYSQAPYTAFAEFGWLHDSGVEYDIWFNANPHTRLERPKDSLDFAYDRYSAGTRLRMPVGGTWWLHADAAGETSGRTWNPFPGATATDLNDRSLQRKHWELNAELHKPLHANVDGWIGLRYFRFEERDRRPQAPLVNGSITLRETMAHLGVVWRVRESVTLWPGLYGQFANSRYGFPGNPAESDNDASFRGKLAVPIEVRFERPAVLTINPTFRLDDLRFGGANVQFEAYF